MSTNLYEIIFVADTATATGNVKGLEAEIARLTNSITTMGAAATAAAAGIHNVQTNAANAAGGVQIFNQHVGGASAQLLNLSNAMQVLGAAMQVFGAVGEKINTAREAMEKMTVEAMKLRDTLREVANLQGKSSPDNEVVGSVLKFGMKAGMMPAESNAFMKQMMGSAEAGLNSGNITPQVLAEVGEIAGAFASRVGLAPETAGDFAGAMAQYQKVPNAQVGAQTLGRVAQGLNDGRGDMTPLMRTLINTAGELVQDGGPVESLEELGVMIGTSSTHAGTVASGTHLRQAVRALRQSGNEHSDWLDQNGRKVGMKHRDILKAIKPAIVAEMKATGKGMDQVLMEHVTDNSTDARSLMEQLNDVDEMDKRMAKNETITADSVLQDNAKWRVSENGRKRVGDAEKAAQGFLLGSQNEHLKLATETAERQLFDEKKIGGVENTWGELIGDGLGLFPFLGYEKHREKLKRSRAMGNLIAEGKRLGISDKEMYGPAGMNSGLILERGQNAAVDAMSDDEIRSQNRDNASGTWQSMSEGGQRDAFRRISRMVEEKNGNYAGTSPDLAAKIDEGNQILRDIRDAQRTDFVGPGVPERARRAPGAAAPRRP